MQLKLRGIFGDNQTVGGGKARADGKTVHAFAFAARFFIANFVARQNGELFGGVANFDKLIAACGRGVCIVKNFADEKRDDGRGGRRGLGRGRNIWRETEIIGVNGGVPCVHGLKLDADLGAMRAGRRGDGSLQSQKVRVIGGEVGGIGGGKLRAGAIIGSIPRHAQAGFFDGGVVFEQIAGKGVFGIFDDVGDILDNRFGGGTAIADDGGGKCAAENVGLGQGETGGAGAGCPPVGIAAFKAGVGQQIRRLALTTKAEDAQKHDARQEQRHPRFPQ